MTRIVINAEHGGYWLSKEAVKLYEKLAGKTNERPVFWWVGYQTR